MNNSLCRVALLFIVMIAFLASCASMGGAGAGDAQTVSGDAPSTRPIGMSTPWSGSFPRDFGEREWGGESENENVVAHNGVLLRGAAGWRFYPPEAGDPETLLLRGRNTSGSADVGVHLLPAELGFDRSVLTEAYAREAIRRVAGGAAPANSELFRVDSDEPGDIVFLGRNFERQASFLIRARPSSRGLFVVTAAGLTPRDQSIANDIVRSFQIVSEDVSLRVPRSGPAFFSRWPDSYWVSDTTGGQLLSLPNSRFALLASSPPELAVELSQGEPVGYLSGGANREAGTARPVTTGSAPYLVATLDEEGHSLLLLGNASDAIRDDGEEALSEELRVLLGRNIIDRAVALEALR